MEAAPGEAFLNAACAGDQELEDEVRSLLASAHDADGFLETSLARDVLALGAGSEPRSVGPYTLLREIGRGGMGTVYLASRSDAEYEGRVAIKLVSRGMDSELVLSRFRAERQILAGLAHPNIARLLDGGTTAEGLPYFVMEFVDGTHILEYAGSAGLDVAGRLALFRKVCEAISFAHRNLVVHLDIKPGNILVTPDGAPKLLDFGLAKLVDPALGHGNGAPTEAARRMLTPEYASPEQIRGERVTTASDVYSLGIVLHRLLTAESPYDTGSGSVEEVSRAVLEQRPRSARGRLGEDLDTILEKALQKEPERRYGSVEQLSEDLRRHLDGLPVLARKDTLAYRTRKFVRRHALAVAASVLVAASIAGGAGTAIWEARRAIRNEALAKKRFEDLRALAHTVMYELHDGVQPLPGSTPVRALLVETSLKYLNALARDAGHDPTLLRELADAYLRIGEVQGGQNQGNLGDTAGALVSLRKSLAIREALAAADPRNDVDRDRLADGLTRTALALARTGRLDEAREHAQRAVDIRERLPGHDAAISRLALGFSNHALGDALVESGDVAGALAAYERETSLAESVAAERPGDLAARGKVAVGLYKLATAFVFNGAFAPALPHLTRAAGIAADVSRAEPGNAIYQRYSTFILALLAAAEMGDGQTAAALEHYRQALALRESMSAADPRNVNLAMHLSALRAEYGEALVSVGRRREGLALLVPALPALEAIAALDPTNIEARYQTALALARDARTRERVNGCAAADPSYGRSLESFDALKGALRGYRARERGLTAAARARCQGVAVSRAPAVSPPRPASPR